MRCHSEKVAKVCSSVLGVFHRGCVSLSLGLHTQEWGQLHSHEEPWRSELGSTHLLQSLSSTIPSVSTRLPPWARGNQLSHTWVSNPQKLWNNKCLWSQSAKFWGNVSCSNGSLTQCQSQGSPNLLQIAPKEHSKSSQVCFWGEGRPNFITWPMPPSPAGPRTQSYCICFIPLQGCTFVGTVWNSPQFLYKGTQAPHLGSLICSSSQIWSRCPASLSLGRLYRS